MTGQAPKVFLSYAWGDDQHQARVLHLAERLQGSGIEVVFDQWDLRPGQDILSFMERVTNDPTVTHVLILLDRQYAERADRRAGGVGTETLIISPNVYQDPKQTRYVPVLFQREGGEPFLPAYLKSRLHFDFSSEAAGDRNWDALLRHLCGILPERPRWAGCPGT